jgi:hypothetical protein
MARGFKTGSRKKGTPNRATRGIRALAQKYTAGALDTLALIMRAAESEQARVSAAKEPLDCGCA